MENKVNANLIRNLSEARYSFIGSIIFLLLIFFYQNSYSQSKCNGLKNFSVVSITGKTINTKWNSIPGAFAYRARIKSPHDSVWNYFMVNAPDTVMQIPKMKSVSVYIVQMGIMCSGHIDDTSDFSLADTLITSCGCELPNKIMVTNIDSSSAAIEWSSTLDSKKFKLFYAPNEQKIKNWLSVTVDATYQPAYILINLKPDTEYVLSLKSICGSAERGISPLFAPYIKFKTLK